MLDSARPDVLRELPAPGTDALWARARIQALFGVASAPEDDRVEKSMMDFGFVAVREAGGDRVATPFVCIDHYGRSGLMLSEQVDAATVEAIGNAFWALVTSGDELADYEDRAFHPGACIWMEYGCRGGALFFDETDED